MITPFRLRAACVAHHKAHGKENTVIMSNPDLVQYIVEQVFAGMNHGQLLVDHPDEVAKQINDLFL